jgi:predicted DNA-binding protein
MAGKPGRSGRPKGKNYPVRITIRLPLEIYLNLKKFAQKKKTTMSKIVRKFLEIYFKENEESKY